MQMVRDSCKIRPYFRQNRIIFDRFVKCDSILLSSSLCKIFSEPHLFEHDKESSSTQSKTFKNDYNLPGKNNHLHHNACHLNAKGRCISCIETSHFHTGRLYNEKCGKNNLSKDKTREATTKCLMEKPKRTIIQAIAHEIRHYYNGSRLLVINTKISLKLAMKLMKGQTLTRRENNLLARTVSDIFRLVPFSLFVIIPFLEFALPFVLKFFPGLLPSTFQTADEKEMKLKNSMKIKMETAKFLLKTLQCMPVASKGCTLDNAKKFQEFALKIYASGGKATREEIIKFSKMFQDDITLNCLSRDQLIALCKVLEISSIGTHNILRFRIRMRLKELVADDKVIQAEGVESLTLEELQQACRARGIRVYDRSKFHLRIKLIRWLELSLNENVPTTLLILSQALMYPGYEKPAEQLKVTISNLPNSVLTQTKAAIHESGEKMDTELKIEALKDELSIIKNENDERNKSKNRANDFMKITSKDIELLENALAKLAITKEKYLMEKENLKFLREELKTYQKGGDKYIDKIKLEVRENCAQALCEKIDGILKKVGEEISACEKNERLGKTNWEHGDSALKSNFSDSRISIDELMSTMRQIQNQLDSNFFNKITELLKNIDRRNEGFINICDILMIIKIMANEKVELNKKQVEEILDILYNQDPGK